MKLIIKKSTRFLIFYIIVFFFLFGFACDNQDKSDPEDSSDTQAWQDDDDDDDNDDNDDDNDDNNDDNDDFDPGIFWAEDFETMSIGPLPPPWTVVENNASARVDKEILSFNQVLKIKDDSMELGDGCSVFLDLNDYPQFSGPVEFTYDTHLVLGIVVGFAMMIRNNDEQIVPAFYVDLEFLAVSALGKYNGREICASLNPFDWHTTKIAIDPENRNFSVWVDEEETNCLDLTFIELSDELVGFTFYGYDGDRWFGTSYFDNLYAAVPEGSR